MPLLKAQGIVIKMVNLGEADKIITLFTDSMGKIEAVAHGARKPKSKLLSSTQIFCYGEYVLYKGKSLYTISQAEIIQSFQELLNDLYTLTYGSYVVELIGVLTQNNEPNIELFALLLKCMYLMTDRNIDIELLIRAFELKSMSISGYMPNLYGCSCCKDKNAKPYGFSSQSGGLVCKKCFDSDGSAIKLDPSTIGLMRYILKLDIEKVGMIKASKNNKYEMKKISKDYIKYYLDKEFKSLEFLDDIKNVDNL